MQTVQGRVKREGIMLHSMSRDVHMLLVVLKTRAHKGHKVANEVIFGHKKQQMTGLSIPCAGDVHFFSRSLKGSFTGDQVQSKKCSFFFQVGDLENFKWHLFGKLVSA